MHRLQDGRNLIHGLSELGKVLSYHVEKEYSVEESESGVAPRVDVAWFRDKGQRFPLMIFEVESTATNSIANNPLKVFSQDTKKFEKPLFFFQIIVSGGANSSSVRNLEEQYGKLNFRIYRLGQGDGNQLICDILSQHRRIRDDFDFDTLFRLLSTPPWTDIASASKALRHAYSIELSPESKLHAYVHLFRAHRNLQPNFVAAITDAEKSNWSGLSEVPAYIGKEWGSLPLCALMICVSQSEREAEDWNEKFLQSNSNRPYLPLVSAKLGDSWDYDQLMLGAAAPLTALCTAVAGAQAKFVIPMAQILCEVLEKLGSRWYGMQTAVWLCHIAGASNQPDFFAKAREYINDFGGLTKEVIYSPPSWACAESVQEEVFPTGNTSLCPTLDEFCELALARWREAMIISKAELALLALDDDMFMYCWADAILGCLWGRQTVTCPERG